MLWTVSLVQFMDRGVIASNGVNGADSGDGSSSKGLSGEFNLDLFQSGTLAALYFVGLMIAGDLCLMSHSCLSYWGWFIQTYLEREQATSVGHRPCACWGLHLSCPQAASGPPLPAHPRLQPMPAAAPVAALLSHRFAATRIIAGGLALWVLAALCCGFAGGYAGIAVLRLLVGAGNGPMIALAPPLIGKAVTQAGTSMPAC